MKNLLLLIFVSLSLSFSNSVFGQIGIETQLGGANFIGATINTRIKIPLNEPKTHFLCPSFGIGMLFPGWDVPTSIINVGLTSQVKNWGLGIEVSGFTDNPFLPSTQPRDFPDMIAYPNVNYTCTLRSDVYLRFSAGLYYAYSKHTVPGSEVTRLRFEGDVIPGAGISFGYLFR